MTAGFKVRPDGKLMAVKSFTTVGSDPVSTDKLCDLTWLSKIVLRSAGSADIDGINKLIATAMDTWQLADPVKRMSLTQYCYHDDDLVHMQLVVAQAGSDRIDGMICWKLINLSLWVPISQVVSDSNSTNHSGLSRRVQRAKLFFSAI